MRPLNAYEIAILQTLINDPTSKILYLAPFRSLAFELERVFSKTLSPLGYSVSHLYGGTRFSAVDRELMTDGDITIATPEKAKAMLRAAPELFEAVKLIIIDEGHLLGDNERNIRNELFLEHLRLLARKQGARILLLSAVLPNAADLAMWIGGDPHALVKSDWKPSAERFGMLRWRKSGASIEWLGGERCFNPHFVEFKKVERITPNGVVKQRDFPADKKEAVAASAVRLAELGPVLIFAGQARWVLPMAKAVLLALGTDAPPHSWPEIEWTIVEAVWREELGDDSFELKAARLGVICHSNKLPPQVRIAIEKLMAKCPPKIVVATTTLGQGVNIGISSVIIATTSIGESSITKRDFWNICGRAGRAFVDSEGKVLYAIDMTAKLLKVKNAEKAAKGYFDIAQLNPAQSGLLQIIHSLFTLASKAGVDFETLLELVANDNFDQCQTEKLNCEYFVDLIDDQLLAFHAEYNRNISEVTVDWVDDVFRDSLAAIQEKNRVTDTNGLLISFLKARIVGVLRKVPLLETQRAVIASGLPMSVGISAFNSLDFFRDIVDRYLIEVDKEIALHNLVSEFENWARINATVIFKNMLNQEQLDIIRPEWLRGCSLRKIFEKSGDESIGVFTDLYGYQLPWLLHAVSQKLDKQTESHRIDTLAKIGLLVELGLPTEEAAKVFLSGVRSRTAAIELSFYVADPSVSIKLIRNDLLSLEKVIKQSQLVSEAAIKWLQLISAEVITSDAPQVKLNSAFLIEVPKEINMLHLRQTSTGETYFCSTDGRFKFGSLWVTQEITIAGLGEVVNDTRFIFERVRYDFWVLKCRDPSL